MRPILILILALFAAAVMSEQRPQQKTHFDVIAWRATDHVLIP